MGRIKFCGKIFWWNKCWQFWYLLRKANGSKCQLCHKKIPTFQRISVVTINSVVSMHVPFPVFAPSEKWKMHKLVRAWFLKMHDSWFLIRHNHIFFSKGNKAKVAHVFVRIYLLFKSLYCVRISPWINCRC